MWYPTFPTLPTFSPSCKVTTIILLLSLLSLSSTVYTYLTLVNTYNLLPDPTQYIKLTAVLLTLAALSISLLNEHIYTLPPGTLLPAMYLTQGTLLLMYGVVMYQAGWSPYIRLGVVVIFTVPLSLIGHFDNTYFQRHLFIELGRQYGVRLGVINSARSVIDNVVAAVQIVIVGLVYNMFSLELSSLILCTSCFVFSLAIASLSFLLFRDYNGTPKRAKKSVSLLCNIKTQFSSLINSKISKVLLVQILDTTTITHTYVYLFLLSAGLDELTMSYLAGATNILFLLSALLNVIKYRFKWSDRFADMFILGHFISLIVSVYLSSCWFYTTFISEEEEIGENTDNTMPLWMVIYFLITLSTGVITGTISLIREEFEQDTIPAHDRGSISGVNKFMSLTLHLVLSLTNLFLTETYLYLVNMTISVIVHIVSLSLMISYKYDDVRGALLHDAPEEEAVLLKS